MSGLLRTDVLQFVPKFPDEKNSKWSGKQSQCSEQFQSGDDGHEKADWQKSQAVAEKPGF